MQHDEQEARARPEGDAVQPVRFRGRQAAQRPGVVGGRVTVERIGTVREPCAVAVLMRGPTRNALCLWPDARWTFAGLSLKPARGLEPRPKVSLEYVERQQLLTEHNPAVED